MKVRRVASDDLPVVAEMMHQALEPFYGGDHRAHAKRIVETSSNGSSDAKGHFSAAQVNDPSGELSIKTLLCASFLIH